MKKSPPRRRSKVRPNRSIRLKPERRREPMDDEEIIELFFARSELAIRELDNKYGKICHNLSYNIVQNRQDAE